jgi:hypothetical protein
MVDPDLLRHVGYAAVKLACGDGRLKDRLLVAVEKLAVVLARRERWPGELLQRAQQIEQELGELSSFAETIEDMDQSTAEHLAERILHLYADVQIAAHDAQKKTHNHTR